MASELFEESPDYVQSLARSLQVLRAFGHDLPSPSLSELATRTDLSRAVVRRILLTLQHLGYVGLRGRSFFLTPRVLMAEVAALGQAAHVQVFAAFGVAQARAVAADDRRCPPFRLHAPAVQDVVALTGHA